MPQISLPAPLTVNAPAAYVAEPASAGAPVSPALHGWIRADLNRLTAAEAWAPHVRGVAVVINASGALQTGARDRLGNSQDRAITALIDACEAAGVSRFVQISAPGATATASSAAVTTPVSETSAKIGSASSPARA